MTTQAVYTTETVPAKVVTVECEVHPNHRHTVVQTTKAQEINIWCSKAKQNFKYYVPPLKS